MESVGKTHVFLIIQHTTHKKKIIPSSTSYHSRLRARYCKGDTSIAKNWPSNNSTPYELWICLRLEVVHSTCTIQRDQCTRNTQNFSYEVRDNYPSCTLYFVILWNAFNIGPSHCMVPKWTYVPKEVLHNTVTQVLQTASHMNIMSHIVLVLKNVIDGIMITR